MLNSALWSFSTSLWLFLGPKMWKPFLEVLNDVFSPKGSKGGKDKGRMGF